MDSSEKKKIESEKDRVIYCDIALHLEVLWALKSYIYLLPAKLIEKHYARWFTFFLLNKQLQNIILNLYRVSNVDLTQEYMPPLYRYNSLI